ncbi:MAG: hypothetical protein G01um101425_718 [Candidatus Peregrinibacteria bacterium Gr01-1014_25]|nr:MAG: hypothetical protein G01um101425_718 [Candidatus Peregrinibacteria bacterium Gr01-1014_25]
MHAFSFLLGSGWSTVWYLLFYLVVLTPLIASLRGMRRGAASGGHQELTILWYVIGTTGLVLFSSVHVILLASAWHLFLPLKVAAIAACTLIVAAIAWSLLPQWVLRPTARAVVAAYTIVLLLLTANLWSLWIIRVRDDRPATPTTSPQIP